MIELCLLLYYCVVTLDKCKIYMCLKFTISALVFAICFARSLLSLCLPIFRMPVFLLLLPRLFSLSFVFILLSWK